MGRAVSYQAAATAYRDAEQEKFRDDQRPAYSHNTAEDEEETELIMAFTNLVHLHRNSFFCPQCCVDMIPFNALRVILLHAPALWLQVMRMTALQWSAYCARGPILSIGK